MLKKNFLVIGGTGFIGFNFLKKIQKFNWEITNISLNYPNKNRLVKKVKYVKLDITSLKRLHNFIKHIDNFDYVINFSGYIEHKNKKKIKKNHFIGPKNLFKVFKKKKIKLFIQAGSSSEYGKQISPHKEFQKGNPEDNYGKFKLLATNFLLECFKKYKFPVVILRFYQLYGPYQKPNRFIPELINCCKKGEIFNTSSGEQWRDFLYIDDAIDSILKCFKSNLAIGKIINIGYGRPIKLKNIMQFVEKKMGNFFPKYGEITLRNDENKYVYPKIALAKKILNWTPKTSLKRGLMRTIKHYKQF